MNMNTRNEIAELVLEAIQNPVNNFVLDILQSYCHLVSIENTFSITLSKIHLEKNTECFNRIWKSHLFIIQKNSPDYLKDWICRINPEIENDYSYIAFRTNQGYQIVNYLRNNPIPKNKNHIEAGIIKASLLFNHGLYFETHEILEEIWLEEVGDIRPFLQGIIQIAVAFHHLLNENYIGAKNLTRDGADKLRSYPSPYYGLDLISFLNGVNRCQVELGKFNKDTITQFNRTLIPKMNLVKKS